VIHEKKARMPLLAALISALLALALLAAVSPARAGETLSYEAEALLETEPATAPLRAQGNCCGVVWSDDAQLWFRSTKVGDTFTVSFHVPAGGSYNVSAFLTRAPDYGIHQLAIDGKEIGEPFDGYAPGVERVGPVAYGKVGLSKGRHELTLTITGKDPASSGYYAGIDVLELRRAGR
jgi:hypothetical protein